MTLHVGGGGGGGGGVETLIFISNKPEAEGVAEPLHEITPIFISCHYTFPILYTVFLFLVCVLVGLILIRSFFKLMDPCIVIQC